MGEPSFTFRVPNLFLDAGMRFGMGYDLRTPGHHIVQFGTLNLPLRVLTIEMQPPKVSR